MLKGRTTYAMSGEVKKPARIAIGDLAPGDVIFFGSRGTQSSSAEVGHIRHLRRKRLVRALVECRRHAAAAAGWYTKTFAWARRPLAEAGLL